MGESRNYNLLHEGVHRWIWTKKWESLREIQERAIEPILSASTDVVISAATAAGKTEAAFLPACSRLASNPVDGIGILYISPLKALINDQHRRLQSLCEIIEIDLSPWHGDIPLSVKNKQLKKPSGIILITPESLESLLINRGAWCVQAFRNLQYIIIDEFHAFIGAERGQQLKSLLHRIEFFIDRKVPRIALSATLGAMDQVAAELRPQGDMPYVLIDSDKMTSDIQIQLRGYLEKTDQNIDAPNAFENVVSDLFRLLRGKSNLVFANSRANTERYAVGLSDLCNKKNTPNEFFPHHGNLTKELRESLEKRLLKADLPTTAICTMTLELGIDIGDVNSIAQVTAPHAVASLRQRLGRSGRRGEPSILRMFITERDSHPANDIVDMLRIETFQCAAMVSLLLNKWFEPANNEQFHFSTLIQQTLSLLAHYGGFRAEQAWVLLCKKGAFTNVDQNMYAQLLRSMGEHELLTQMQDGQLVLGLKGERLVENYTFYSAFTSPEEYSLENNGKRLGTIPITFPPMKGQLIIFAGKRWEVLSISDVERTISLKFATKGEPPKFDGGGQIVHDIVRQEMKRLYIAKNAPSYFDTQASIFFEQGVNHFYTLGLDKHSIIELEGHTIIATWLGDKVANTITALLRNIDVVAECYQGFITVKNSTKNDCLRFFQEIYQNPAMAPVELVRNNVKDPATIIEKHDYFVPLELRHLNYSAKFYDIAGANKWMNQMIQ